MLGQCLGEWRVRQIQRALRRGKLTLLYLFLTVIVLRGTIGAGKFGTLEQDFNEIRQHLRQHLRHYRSLPHRTLVEHQTDHSSAATAGKTFVPDEGDDDPPRDPNIPYSLGPKISYWDDQRAT